MNITMPMTSFFVQNEYLGTSFEEFVRTIVLKERCITYYVRTFSLLVCIVFSFWFSCCLSVPYVANLNLGTLFS